MALLGLPVATHAQQGTREAHVVRIADCQSPCGEVVLTKVGVVGGEPEDSVLLGWRGAPVQLANGGWVSSATYQSGVVAIFDSTGHLVRTFGREGGGPGEFREPRAMPGPIGYAWIVDAGNQRITVLEGEGKVVGAFGLSGFIAYCAPLDSQRVVVHGTIMDGGRLLPGQIHILNNRGEVLKSFAEGAVARDARSVFPSPRGSFLAPLSESYAVQEWSLDGELLRILVRGIDWFQHSGRRTDNNPALLSAAVDHAGLMWTVSARPTTTGPVDRTTRGFAAITALHTGVIEVVDLATARVVATGEVGLSYLAPLLPFKRLFISPAEDDAGYIHFDVWRAAVAPGGE